MHDTDGTSFLYRKYHPVRMMLQFLEQEFSICKSDSANLMDVDSEFLFYCRTDNEISVVCPSSDVPEDCISCRDDGWMAFRIVGTLDLSLIGILSKITGILARENIGVFVVSTFDTDYVLVRKDRVSDTVNVLSEAGYEWIRNMDRA